MRRNFYLLCIYAILATFHTSQAIEFTEYETPLEDGEVNAADFVGKDIGWLVGNDIENARAAILKTTDGGENWTDLEADFNAALYDVKFFSETVGYCAGQSYDDGTALLRKSTDAGVSWNAINLPSFNGSVRQTLLSEDGRSWLVGNRFNNGIFPVAMKSDNLTDWSLATLPEIEGWLTGVAFKNTSLGWITGESMNGEPILFQTTDGGENWTRADLPISEGGLEDVLVTGTGKIILSGSDGSDGILLTSDDDGVTWDRTTIDVELPGIIKSDTPMGGSNIYVKVSTWLFMKLYFVVQAYVNDTPYYQVYEEDEEGDYIPVSDLEEGTIETCGEEVYEGDGGELEGRVIIPVKKPEPGGGNKKKGGILISTPITPDPTQCTLSVSVSPAKAAAAGCTASGSGVYQTPTTVDVSAFEGPKDNGWNFDVWGGKASGKALHSTVSLGVNETSASATANFIEVYLTLGGENNDGFFCKTDVANNVKFIDFTLQPNEKDDWWMSGITFGISHSGMPEGALSNVDAHFEFDGTNYGPDEITISDDRIVVAIPSRTLKAGDIYGGSLILRFNDFPAELENVVKIDIAAAGAAIAAVPKTYSSYRFEGSCAVTRYIIGVHNETKNKFYANIRDALEDKENAADADIFVCPGTYDEELTIANEKFRLKSYGNRDNTFITKEAIFAGASDFTIDGFTFDGMNNSFATVTLLSVFDASFENCAFRNAYRGVYSKKESKIGIFGTRRISFKSNIFKNNSLVDAEFRDMEDLIFSGNTLESELFGVVIVYPADGWKIHGNSFRSSSGNNAVSSIDITGSPEQYSCTSANRIYKNVFNLNLTDSFDPSTSSSAAIRITKETDAFIHDNTIKNCDIGFEAKHSYEAHFYLNIVNECRIGAWIESSDNVNLSSNDLQFNLLQAYKVKDCYKKVYKGNKTSFCGKDYPNPGLIKKNDYGLSDEFRGGALLDNSTVTIGKNQFESDSSSAIILINGSEADIHENNFFDNEDFAIEAFEGNTANASGNYWGATDGPSGEGTGSGDAVSEYVDFSDHLNERVDAVCFPGKEIYYVPSKTRDSIMFFYRNFVVPDDEFAVTLTDYKGWISGETEFDTGKLDSIGYVKTLYVETPDPGAGELEAWIVSNAVSKNDGNIKDKDSTKIVAYRPLATEIYALPDTNKIESGGECLFQAGIVDQYGRAMDFDIEWSVKSGGNIDQNGIFTSDGTLGVFPVQASHDELVGVVYVEVVDQLSVDDPIDIDKMGVISIIPNPFETFFIIESEDFIDVREIILYDQRGIKVFEFGEVELSTEIELPDLTSGVYILLLRTREETYFKKLFKID